MDRPEPQRRCPRSRPPVRLSPLSSPRPVEDILRTVEAWSFPPETCDVDLDVVAEDSLLSMARRSPRPSFLAIRNRLLGHESTEFQTESEQLDEPLPERQPTVTLYEGPSHLLEIREQLTLYPFV